MSYQDTLRENITLKIVDALEKGVSPWRQPWSGGGMPKNVASKKHYRGINILLLAIHQSAHSLRSTVYGTFKQWQDKGCQVKKRPADVKEGQWGAGIIFYQPIRSTKTLANGEVKEFSFPLLKTYWVFSADQVEGGEKFMPEVNKTNEIPAHDVADQLVKATEAKIKIGGHQAAYFPHDDYISMPERNLFGCTESYYGTLLHELTHWTGNETRLNRPLKLSRFGGKSYAVEELVAEIGGCYLLGACDLPVLDKLENHASYLQSWLQVLKEDSKAIFQATAAASAAADYCLNLAGMGDEKAAEPEPELAAV